MAASADETSVSVAIKQVLSELQSISSLKEEQNTALEAFLRGKYVFALLPTGLGKSSLACGCFRRRSVKWSNSASVRVLTKPKEKRLRAAVPSVRSVNSNSTESTSASSDSSQRDSFCKRPNLDLFVNSVVLPRAQTGATDTQALSFYKEMNLTSG